MHPRRRALLLKAGVWALCLAPLGWAAYRFFLGDGFGANPIEALEHWSGLTTLTVLLGALAVTPLRRLTGLNDLQKVRRLVGLFAFFYASIHFMMWIGLDQFFAWEYIGEDIAERPYILVGFTAFLLLVPLALTSTKGWIRRLGKRWTHLHRLVYLAAALGVLHWWWLKKADFREPFIATVVLALLLGFRVVWAARRRVAKRNAEKGSGARRDEAPAGA